ncbi:MAG: hypothetical protein GX234_07285 [Clostridiales bacterium]|nr:hypothetical protein [Clostridiales bacterium]
MIIQMLMLAGLLFLVPFLAGLLPVRFMDDRHKNLGMVYVSGWLVLFALFQFMIIPFIVAQKDFADAAKLYNVLMLIAVLAGLLLGAKMIKECFVNTFRFKFMERGSRILWSVVIVLIVLQMVTAVFMQYLDGDDALYVAISAQTQSGDGMYLKNPYYGYAQELDVRHALSPVPIFIAWIGRLTGIHATILSHCFIGPVFLLLMYALYGQIAKRLFEDRPQNIPLFLLFLNIWYLFGNVSLYTAETFAYTRTWQGKAMFGNLVVPAMVLWMLFVVRDEMRCGEWCMLFALSAVAAFTTSTGIFMFPIFVAMAGLILAVYKKKLVILFEFAACCIPSLVYGILYLFLK